MVFIDWHATVNEAAGAILRLPSGRPKIAVVRLSPLLNGLDFCFDLFNGTLRMNTKHSPVVAVASRFARAARALLVGAAATAVFAGTVLSVTSQAKAWDAIGHRTITWLAMDGLKDDMPAFLKDQSVRAGIAWQAAEPDRWRGLKNPYIMNTTYGDHFIDVEDLKDFGLTLETVSPLRYRFVRDMAVARHVHPMGPDEKGEPYNERLDPTGQKQWTGFVPHAIVENHAKLMSMFKTFRILEKINDPKRAPQLEMAKANIATTMGIMSHYVGDTAQPLHTTKHYNGWVGENPNGYTTARTIHAYIDGGVIAHHKLDYNALKAEQKFDIPVPGIDPWNDVITYVKRSHDKVEPLYAMEKAGKLQQSEGKAFISERLHDAAAMLAAMYNSAWAASTPTDTDIADFKKYDNFDVSQGPAAAAPAANGQTAK